MAGIDLRTAGGGSSSGGPFAPVSTTTIDLVDRTNNTTETVPAGTTTNCSTAGVTKTAPALDNPVSTPPKRFAIKNLSTGSITVAYPDQTGATQSLTMLTGETRTFRQKSTSGWGVESGALAVATMDGRYQPVAWVATAAYSANQLALDPSGTLISRIAAGTSRASFDATEKALWNYPGSAAYAPITPNPNDVGYDVVLLIGQSNMAGRGTVTDTHYDITDPRIFTYGNPAQTANAYNSVISQAQEFLLHRDGAVGVGPGLNFARWLTTVTPVNRRVLLVPCAVGGTPLVPTNQLSWNSTIAAGANGLYQAALATCRAALTQAGSNSRVVAALWVQGETDGDSSTTGAAYQAALDALIAQLRTDLALPSLPFVVGQMVPDYLATGTRAAINTQHLDTPRRLTSTGFGYGPAGSAYNNGDGNHYNAIGQRGPVTKPAVSLGHSMFLAYQRALLNVTGVAPVVPAAPTVTQTSATAVAVSWGQVSGRATDYNVRYSTNGGTSWTNLTRAQSIDVTAAITGLTGGATVLVEVATVNEAGTSAWSAPTTLALAQAPNPITGLTSGTALATQQPLSWTAPATDGTHSAATSYLVEYQLHTAGSWTPFATVTTTSATVTGLTPSTAYDYRVTAINVAGSAAVVTASNLSTAASTSPLTTMGVSAWRAYSPARKLVDTYAGSAVQVRSSGGTLTDIGFDGSGNLDTTALATAAAGGTLTVQKLYDQSGNGHDLTQATAAAQARIVNAGTIDTVGGKPTLVFSGAQFYTDTTGLGMYAGGALTALSVLKGAQPSVATSLIVGESSTSSVNTRYWIYGGSANTNVNEQIRNDAATVLSTGAGTVALLNGTANQHSFYDSGTQVAQYVNGATAQALANYTNARSGSLTPTNFAIGTGYAGTATATNFFTGSISEILLIQSAVVTATRQTGEANQKSYYGTP